MKCTHMTNGVRTEERLNETTWYQGRRERGPAFEARIIRINLLEWRSRLLKTLLREEISFCEALLKIHKLYFLFLCDLNKCEFICKRRFDGVENTKLSTSRVSEIWKIAVIDEDSLFCTTKRSRIEGSLARSVILILLSTNCIHGSCSFFWREFCPYTDGKRNCLAPRC